MIVRGDVDELIRKGQFVCLREYPGFGVSCDGRVWSCRGHGYRCRVLLDAWRPIRLTPMRPRKYLFVVLDGKKKYIHRLVLEAFVGPCPPGLECCHLDDNPEHNDVKNLRWDTRLSNVRDSIRNGRMARGIRHGMVRLEEKDIERIFDLRRQGLSLSQISVASGISNGHVSRILNGRLWGHMQQELGYDRQR